MGRAGADRVCGLPSSLDGWWARTSDHALLKVTDGCVVCCDQAHYDGRVVQEGDTYTLLGWRADRDGSTPSRILWRQEQTAEEVHWLRCAPEAHGPVRWLDETRCWKLRFGRPTDAADCLRLEQLLLDAHGDVPTYSGMGREELYNKIFAVSRARIEKRGKLWCSLLSGELPYYETLVIESPAETVVGLMHYGLPKPRERTYAYVWQLCVDPEYRGKGLGTRLVHHATTVLHRGMEFRLDVATRATTLYERLGFHPVGKKAQDAAEPWQALTNRVPMEVRQPADFGMGVRDTQGDSLRPPVAGERRRTTRRRDSPGRGGGGGAEQPQGAAARRCTGRGRNAQNAGAAAEPRPERGDAECRGTDSAPAIKQGCAQLQQLFSAETPQSQDSEQCASARCSCRGCLQREVAALLRTNEQLAARVAAQLQGSAAVGAAASPAYCHAPSPGPPGAPRAGADGNSPHSSDVHVAPGDTAQQAEAPSQKRRRR